MTELESELERLIQDTPPPTPTSHTETAWLLLTRASEQSEEEWQSVTGTARGQDGLQRQEVRAEG